MTDAWDTVARSAGVAVLAYAALTIVLRVSGKRTLAKLNAFDLVVTVAFGSCLATAIVDTSVSAAEAAVAFAVLAVLQAAVAWTSTRWRRARRTITSRPTAVVVDGELQHDVMHRERIAVDDVRTVMRSRGLTDLEEVGAVVLESSGTLSVVERTAGWALDDVDGIPSRS
jgi:uncharacterized membrane protein YcaP (DUF421 family)